MNGKPDFETVIDVFLSEHPEARAGVGSHQGLMTFDLATVKLLGEFCVKRGFCSEHKAKQVVSLLGNAVRHIKHPPN